MTERDGKRSEGHNGTAASSFCFAGTGHVSKHVLYEGLSTHACQWGQSIIIHMIKPSVPKPYLSSILCFQHSMLLAVSIGWSRVDLTHKHSAFGLAPHQPSVQRTLYLAPKSIFWWHDRIALQPTKQKKYSAVAKATATRPCPNRPIICPFEL